MAKKQQSLADKIARILKEEFNLDAKVEGLATTGESGIRVSVGDFVETLSGTINREKVEHLAVRIRAAHSYG